MKKTIFICIAVLLMTTFCGCNGFYGEESEAHYTTTPVLTDSHQTSVEYYNYYELHEIKDENNQTVKYQYSILDQKGNVMDTQEWEGSMPEISVVSGCLVKVVLPDGTLPAIHRYYDVVLGKKSQDFESVYDDDHVEQLVAYFTCPEDDIYDVTLVVCDIFEPKTHRMEIKKEFVSMIRPADCVRFLSKGKLYLEYDVFATGGLEDMLANGEYSFREVEEIVDITEVYQVANKEN